MKTRIALLVGQTLDALTLAAFFIVVPPVVIDALGKTERNPIVATLLAIGGFGLVIFVKVGLASWVAWRDWRRPNRPKKTAFVMGLAAVSGFIGAAFNLIALQTVLSLTGGLG